MPGVCVIPCGGDIDARGARPDILPRGWNVAGGDGFGQSIRCPCCLVASLSSEGVSVVADKMASADSAKRAAGFARN